MQGPPGAVHRCCWLSGCCDMLALVCVLLWLNVDPHDHDWVHLGESMWWRRSPRSRLVTARRCWRPPHVCAAILLSRVVLFPVAGLLKRKGKQCNCKNSRCLKLYCECFASGQYCEPGVCNCTNCFNNRVSVLTRCWCTAGLLQFCSGNPRGPGQRATSC
jgi:hypothetical protein